MGDGALVPEFSNLGGGPSRAVTGSATPTPEKGGGPISGPCLCSKYNCTYYIYLGNSPCSATIFYY